MRSRITALALAGALGLASGSVSAQMIAANYLSVALAAADNATEQVQELLLEGGSDPDGVDSVSKHTALDYAAAFDNVVMAKLLLDHGAHVDAHDLDKSTALHFAAERGSIEMMRFLLASHAAIDAVNRQGVTPLMLAAGHDQPGAVRFLLASGADPKRQDFTGRDAAGWAVGKPAVLEALNPKR
jgi:uncharacterized protein